MKVKGEGTLFKHCTGRWAAQVQIDGVRKTVYGRTRKEAAEKLAALKAEALQTGRLPNPGRRTVSDLLAVWLETKAPGWKLRTLSDYTQTVERYLQPEIGDVPLSRLDAGRIARLTAKFVREGKHRTALRVYRTLSQALDTAVRWGWLSSNPCRRVDAPKYAPSRREPWSPEQVRLFIEGASEHWLWPLWVILIATGCRLGEAMALRWCDVDLDAGTTRVRRSAQHVKRLGWVETAPKTKAGERVVALPKQAVEALRRQRAWQLWNGISSDLVFCRPKGTHLNHDVVGRNLRAECERLGLPPMTPHGLRHLHASLLLAQGVPLSAVSARLGHANTQVTASIYAHALKGADRRAAEAVEGVMGDVGP
ncbi:MAG: site-specific integrase [Armatimonadota bacterium]